MSIFMLSLAGMPPLAGFFGKFYLFSAALRAGANHGLLWLVVLALFGSLISLYYYLMVLKVIFVDRGGADHRSPITDRFTEKLAVSALAALVLFFGVMPQTLAARILACFP